MMGGADIRRRHFFTLIELLVVVAIISLLAALLMPALRSTVAAARRASCSSQMRQVSLMFLTYANNYRSQQPPLHVSNVWNPPGWQGITINNQKWNWREFLFYDTFGVMFNTSYPVGLEKGLPLDSRTAVFRCPSIVEDPTPTLTHHYNLNRKNLVPPPYYSWECPRIDSWPSLDIAPGATGTYADPTCILMYDYVYQYEDGSKKWWRAPYKNESNLRLRHLNGSANFLFGDSHVESANDFHTIQTNQWPWSKR